MRKKMNKPIDFVLCILDSFVFDFGFRKTQSYLHFIQEN